MMRPDSASSTTTGDVVDIIAADPRFKKLVCAWGAARLLRVLKGRGPFTVLAPTDRAFAKLPAGGFEKLLYDIPSLRGVLLYHVLPGAITVEELGSSTEIMTALGEPLSTVGADRVALDRLDKGEPGISAANGRIYVIDGVLMPPGVQL